MEFATIRLWRRNPLARIIARTVFCALVFGCGCTTRRTLELNAQNPAVRVSTRGVLFGDRHVQPGEVVEILEDYDVPHDRTIHILLDPDVKDLSPARFLMATLARAGYTRPVLVTSRHAEAINVGKKKKTVFSGNAQAPAAPKKTVIRYKRATE